MFVKFDPWKTLEKTFRLGFFFFKNTGFYTYWFSILLDPPLSPTERTSIKNFLKVNAQQTVGKTCLPEIVEFIAYLCGFETKFTRTLNKLQFVTLFYNIPDVNWFVANNYLKNHINKHITSHLTGLRRKISATTNSKLSQKLRKIIARELKLIYSKPYYKTGSKWIDSVKTE